MYGFTELLLYWFYSFISRRTKNVKYQNYLSKKIFITSDVFQKDHLSPVLFGHFINDMSDVISHSKVQLLAHDAKNVKKY